MNTQAENAEADQDADAESPTVLFEGEFGDSCYILVEGAGAYTLTEYDISTGEEPDTVATKTTESQAAAWRWLCALICSDQPDLSKEAKELGTEGFGVA